MARKVEDFTSAFDVSRRDLLNMEKRALPLLTDKPYFRDLGKPVEPRDELGRALAALCLNTREEANLRKHCTALNKLVRAEGRLDGRSPMTIVASLLRLVSRACDIKLPKHAIEEACGVATSTIWHVAALIAAQPGMHARLTAIRPARATRSQAAVEKALSH